MTALEKATQIVLRALHRRPEAPVVYIGDFWIRQAGIEAIERDLRAQMGDRAPRVRTASAHP